MARHEIPEGYTVGLLATMPRSGTWYSFYFFEFLDLYLTGRTTLQTRMELEVYHGLKVGKISVHSICPGFLEVYFGPYRQPWDDLEFYVDGYNYGYQKFIGGNIDVFSPASNSDIRIIYLYRNPLDQAVSYFRHAQHNKNEHKTYRNREDGTVQEFSSASEFLRFAGLEAYIKQYFTFHVMAERFPQNILMVSYEELMKSPTATFGSMLEFWNVPIEEEEIQAQMRKALNSCSPQSLKNIEQALGSSLARDQAESSESHLRGGATGKWKQILDGEDKNFAADQFANFGISLDCFNLE